MITRYMECCVRLGGVVAASLALAACGEGAGSTGSAAGGWECVNDEGSDPDALERLGCEADFLAVAAVPGDSTLPGALSVKTIIDRVDGDRLYFQNSTRYPLHYDFASTHLSAVGDLPLVGDERSFNDNYYTEQRRFVLGAVTHYEGPGKWVFELSPYDNASASLVGEAFQQIAGSVYFGDELYFHPSSDAAEAAVDELPERVKVLTTNELYAGIDYQPLALGKSCGTLVFTTASNLEDEYVGFQDIVVLDRIPNDISVTQGVITAEFQTPLSHVNVLSQNRGTPNMGLRGAFDDPELRALEGEWVTLEVGSNAWSIEASDPEDSADCLIQPTPIEITPMDLSKTELTNVEDLYDPSSNVPMREQIRANVPAFGGKASNFAVLSYIEAAHAPKAFVIPVYFYDLFMTENGFDARLRNLLADTTFNADAAVRDEELAALRADMLEAPINEDFLTALYDKLEREYPGVRMRFRSSTNAEDLGDFTGAGLYTSKSGQPGSADEPIEAALRTVWSSVWFFRAFEERSYRGIDHTKVGMALLVHNSFPDEEINGVAVTANPFDTAGVEPGFYVNAQIEDKSVVAPAPGVTTDQFVHYFDMPGEPIVFLEHSNLVAPGETVLTRQQTHELGVALKAIHQYFYPAYGGDQPGGWYAMDIEFKFDGPPGEEPALWIKQARPYPGRKRGSP